MRERSSSSSSSSRSSLRNEFMSLQLGQFGLKQLNPGKRLDLGV